VTFTADVTSGGSPVTSGTVQFFNGTSEITGIDLNGSGQAVLNYAGLPAGTDSITAKYLGSANDVGSASASVSQVVNGDSTSTTLSTSPNPSSYGQMVTFTANVTSGGSPVTSGTVQFFDGTSIITGVNLNSAGQAVLNYAGLPAGTDSITAKYLGDGNYLSSTSAPMNQVVSGLSTMTGLTTSPNPSTYGQMVTFTATVTSGGKPVTYGTVQFFNDGVIITGVDLNSSGVAVLNYSLLPGGTDTITAKYLGYADYLGSMSMPMNQLVNPVPTTTSLITA
jgi:trimeric autotransporter adhesin